MAIRDQHLIAALFEQLHRTGLRSVMISYLLSRCFIILLDVDRVRSVSVEGSSPSQTCPLGCPERLGDVLDLRIEMSA